MELKKVIKLFGNTAGRAIFMSTAAVGDANDI